MVSPASIVGLLSSYFAAGLIVKRPSPFPQETIDLIADTFTEGYRIGFVNTGKDLSKKTTVNIRYPLGFERIIRQAVRNFEVMGLKPIIYRAGNSFFRRQGTSKVGYFGANPNKQYDYDHKEDEALFLTGQFVTRKLECLRAAFDEQKENANGHAGPAVMEIFGETPFVPVVKETACALSPEQQKLSVKYAMQSGKITNEYIKGDSKLAQILYSLGANYSFLTNIIRKSIYEYYVGKRYLLKNQKKVSNKFEQRLTPKTDELALLQLDMIISSIEAKWVYNA